MRRRSAAIAAAAAVSTLAPTASPAMVVGLSIAPTAPHVGERITLSLRVYAPEVDPAMPCGFKRTPWRVDYPFRVQATAPDGTAYRIRVRQAEENLYGGTLRLAKKPGVWTIRVLNFFPFDPCSGGRLRFRVRR
jgi:hypothetical protein